MIVYYYYNLAPASRFQALIICARELLAIAHRMPVRNSKKSMPYIYSEKRSSRVAHRMPVRNSNKSMPYIYSDKQFREDGEAEFAVDALDLPLWKVSNQALSLSPSLSREKKKTVPCMRRRSKCLRRLLWIQASSEALSREYICFT